MPIWLGYPQSRLLRWPPTSRKSLSVPGPLRLTLARSECIPGSVSDRHYSNLLARFVDFVQYSVSVEFRAVQKMPQWPARSPRLRSPRAAAWEPLKRIDRFFEAVKPSTGAFRACRFKVFVKLSEIALGTQR